MIGGDAAGGGGLSDKEILDVRANRTSRAVDSFMRVGDAPSSLKHGLMPGLLGGIAVSLVAIIAVGGVSLATGVLGGSGSPTPTASAPVVASASVSSEATSVAPPTPAASVTVCTANPCAVSFTFKTSDLGWTGKAAGAAGASFSVGFDSSFGKPDAGGALTSGSLKIVASSDGGAATGTASYGNSWEGIHIPAGATVVSVAASYDCYVKSFDGTVKVVSGSLDLQDASGTLIAHLIPESKDQAAGSWTNHAGPTTTVPAAYGASGTGLKFVLNSGISGSGGATWYVDNIRLVIAYR
jgi:hypothetical protein